MKLILNQTILHRCSILITHHMIMRSIFIKELFWGWIPRESIKRWNHVLYVNYQFTFCSSPNLVCITFVTNVTKTTKFNVDIVEVLIQKSSELMIIKTFIHVRGIATKCSKTKQHLKLIYYQFKSSKKKSIDLYLFFVFYK